MIDLEVTAAIPKVFVMMMVGGEVVVGGNQEGGPFVNGPHDPIFGEIHTKPARGEIVVPKPHDELEGRIGGNGHNAMVTATMEKEFTGRSRRDGGFGEKEPIGIRIGRSHDEKKSEGRDQDDNGGRKNVETPKE